MSSSDANAIAAILIEQTSRFIAEKYARKRDASAINDTCIRLENFLQKSDVSRDLVNAVENADSNFRRNALDGGFEPGVIHLIASLPANENPQFQNLIKNMFSRPDIDVQSNEVERYVSRILEKGIDKDQLLAATMLYMRILRNELFRAGEFAHILRSLMVNRDREANLSTKESLGIFPGKLSSILSDANDPLVSKSAEELLENKLAGDTTTDAPPPYVKKKNKGK